jgi:NADPH:quinone reductase-like Zn-dependent oxidoreductase
MKALHLTAPNKLEIVEKEIPHPTRKGQVLIKMAYSPINPSDLAFLTGQYGIQKPYPNVPGFEGSGVVVESGGGFYANYLKGKKVACVAAEVDGTFAEYMLTGADKCVVLGNDVDLKQGAMSFVNPLTAIELAEMAKTGGYTAIVMSAAASALSNMVNYQAKKNGLDFAGVVRRQEQVDNLTSWGVDYIANSSEVNWMKGLKEWAKKHKKILFLDAVGGGELPSQILSCMPPKSKMIVYGMLDLENPPKFSPRDFIFYEYEIAGYWLSKTVTRKSFLQTMIDTRKVQAMLKDGFETKINKKISLDNFKEALKEYSTNMSAGKILFEL